jgi:hypothetical protein
MTGTDLLGVGRSIADSDLPLEAARTLAPLARTKRAASCQYHHQVPQCLVIAPSYADLSPLRAVLQELDTGITTTTQLLVGAQLATVSLDMFDFAVAVLPATGPDGAPATTPSAVYLEAGIALGRGLPLIVLVEDADADLPGIGGLASDVWMVAGVKDEASLRLHLSLFSKVLAVRRPPGGADLHAASPPPVLALPPSESIGVRAWRLEDLVLFLLQAAGAQVEEPRRSGRDGGVDAAVLIPGAEHALGPVLIEVKALRGDGLSTAMRQLATFVVERGATLGLVVYDGPHQEQPPRSDLPVLAMQVGELRRQVESGTLGRTLIHARNSFVHGSRRDL